jgi:hypothetical protein
MMDSSLKAVRDDYDKLIVIVAQDTGEEEELQPTH